MALRGHNEANPARVAAARALLAVERGAHVEDALHENLRHGDDRGLAWYLALGVLRRRGHVDAALRAHLSQPLEGIEPPVRAALRIGAFEKLYARTGEHAAVHQGVELAKALGVGRASGLVNAVLRKVEAPTGLARADALDHPAWLVARWDARYGPEATDRWCERNAEPPTLTVVTRDPDDAMGEPVTLQGAVLRGVWKAAEAKGAVPERDGFAEGRFWVQDAAAVAVADLLADAKTVLDACAAPGGKSFRLASRGKEVLAADRDPDRLLRVREGARRLGLQVTPRVHDWTRGPLPGRRLFDGVLVDAPCTGLGTVRRHPEVRWRRQLVDVLTIPDLQRAILESASTHVRPGGALVYAVCSPEPEEGEGVVTAFLAAHPEFRLDRTLSTAPPEGDEDAHYAARMVRA